MFEPVEYDLGYMSGARIKVVGVGGGGGNAVNHMVKQTLQQHNVDGAFGDVGMPNDEHGTINFYAINTDAQALRKSLVSDTIQIGGELTKGLGAGANPNVGRQAAEDDQEGIRQMLEGADMVFIAAGMGGGTGTGAAPIVAQIAKELGILTVAVVTKPFSFEGKKRMMFAEMGIKELYKHVDSLIVIPNSQLAKALPKNAKLMDAFSAANDVLNNSVMGISDMITSPGLINVDFADVKTVMSEMGQALIGFGAARGEAGEGRAEEAARIAVKSDLLEHVDLTGAKGVLVNVASGYDLTLDEFETIGETIKSFASDDATIVVGTSLMPDMVDEIRVTIVATGIGEPTNEVQPQIQNRPINQPLEATGGLRPVSAPFGGLGSQTTSGYAQSQPAQQPQPVEQPNRPAQLAGDLFTAQRFFGNNGDNNK